jgi:hypothetical protein
MRLYAGLADLAEQVVTLVCGRCLSPSWAVMCKGREGSWMCQVASAGADHQFAGAWPHPKRPRNTTAGAISAIFRAAAKPALLIFMEAAL